MDLGLRLIELGAVGPGIDLKKKIVFFHLRPFLERHLHQITGDPGLDVHRMNCVSSTGVVHVIGHLSLDWLADRHRRRLGWGNLWRIIFTAANHRR